MSENSEKKESSDPKAKMLEALAKKQKGHNTGKSAGQTGGAAPKMHRRKAGSA
jgi:hypothetical protein